MTEHKKEKHHTHFNKVLSAKIDEEYLEYLLYNYTIDDSDYLSRFSLSDFLRCSLILSDQFFRVFSNKNNQSQLLKRQELIDGLMSIYQGELSKRIEITFQILDCAESGKIYKSDVALLAKYFHLSCNFDPQMLDHLESIVDMVFNGKKFLKYEEYAKCTKMNNSDLFLLFTFFIKELTHINIEAIQYFNESCLHKTFEKNESSYDEIVSSSELLMEYFSLISENYEQEDYFTEECSDYDFLKEKNVNIHIEETTIGSLSTSSCPSEISNINIGQNLTLKNNINYSSPNSTIKREAKVSSVIQRRFSINAPKISSHSPSEKLGLALHKYTSMKINMNIPTKEFYFFCNLDEKYQKMKFTMVKDFLFYFQLSENDSIYEFKGIMPINSAYIDKPEEIVINNMHFYHFTIISFIEFKPISTHIYCLSEEEMKSFISEINRVSTYRKIQDDYELKEEIGHGNFSKVRVGIHRKTLQKVAVKVIRKKKFMQYSNSIEMVKSEIDIFHYIKKQRHPNIIKAMDHYESISSVYLVYEYIECGNLSTFLSDFRNQQSFDLLVPQILAAVAFCHKNGIVHRDLKPENILITYTFRMPVIKLIDFGLGKMMVKHQYTYEPYGSLCYTAPEILLGVAYNHQVDVWSIGVIAYYIIYGCLPFDDPEDDMKKISMRIISGKYNTGKTSSIYSAKAQWVIEMCLKCQQQGRLSVNKLIRYTKQ